MADPTYQVHDWEPGIAVSGLFWTIPISPGSIKANPSTGRARFRVEALKIGPSASAVLVRKDAVRSVGRFDEAAAVFDDYDLWLGTGIIKPWIAYRRHTGVANYLYLDGHVSTLSWDDAVRDMYPDKVVLTADGSYPY